jgi:ubiquinone/menaquinone biosynthesis C-methylase UbiE
MPVNTTSWNRARYGALATVYDLAISPLQLLGFGAARREAISWLSLEPGARLLIVGAGTGLDLPHIPAGVEIVATDLAPQMVRRASRRAASLGLDGEFLVMDGERLDFPNASFDHVVLHLVLAVMPDPEACAREVRRVLRPGGTVSIFDKFVPDGGRPSVFRRGLNTVANAAFSDITRSLGPILQTGRLELVRREERILGLFSIAMARADETAPIQ